MSTLVKDPLCFPFGGWISHTVSDAMFQLSHLKEAATVTNTRFKFPSAQRRSSPVAPVADGHLQSTKQKTARWSNKTRMIVYKSVAKKVYKRVSHQV